MSGVRSGALAVVALLWSLVGVVGPARAAVLEVVISGALALPPGESDDGRIQLRLGSNLPVSLVESDRVVPGVIAEATFVEWFDAAPTAGFGPVANLIVFRLGGGVMVVAGGIVTASGGPGVPSRFVTTFSATSPLQTLSGTWSLASAGAKGVAGAGIGDAVVTFTYDTNPGNTFSGVARFVAAGALASRASSNVPGLATVEVLRNVPVRDVPNNTVDGQIGTLTSYAVRDVAGHPSEYAALTAINFGELFLLYGCAFPQLPGGIACPVGATDAIAHLSGNMGETDAQFVTDITGLNPSDLVLRLVGSLP